MSSDDESVVVKTKSKKAKIIPNSDLHSNIFPIKLVDKSSNTLQNKVLIGKGINTLVLAILKNANKSAKRVWRVLLNSGSDGDTLFIQKGLSDHVPFK